MDLRGKKILVCGMARSGQAAALALARIGAEVTATDIKSDIAWDCDYAAEGIKFTAAADPTDLLIDREIVIISPGISVYAPFVQNAQSRGIPVWGEAELAYRLCPCPIIAITGTNGKTTVTTLVGEIVKLHNFGTVIAGNIGIPLSSLVMGLKPENMVVAEISSFQLETISAFQPAVSAVLNMTEDHLDRHMTMENYIAAKSRIFENQRQTQKCVLNYDNIITKNMKPPCEVLYFSAKAGRGEICNEKNIIFIENGMIIARLDGAETEIMPIAETIVLAENALAATALSLCADVPPQHIMAVLRDFKGVPHRLEFVAEIGGVSYYNDSKATNTDAAIKALENFTVPVILIAGGKDKKADFTPWVELFGSKVKRLIVMGETAEQIIADCEKVGFSRIERVSSMVGAVNQASKTAQNGDIVLLSPACASFDMFNNFEHRGEMFMRAVYGLQEQ